MKMVQTPLQTSAPEQPHHSIAGAPPLTDAFLGQTLPLSSEKRPLM